MKKEKIEFIKKGIVFILLFIILSSLPLGLSSFIFFSSKEHLPINHVVALQNNQDNLVLYGKAYSHNTQLYKLKLINSNKCSVMALGTSRVMQFRDHFFNKSFCNAGGGVVKIGQFETFLKKINIDKKPKLLIIGLDQYFFNNNYDGSGNNGRSLNLNERSPFLSFQRNLSKIYQDYFKNKINLSKLLKNNKYKIGLSAIMKENGFRNDGSYYYEEIIRIGSINNPDHNDYNFTETFKKIRNGNHNKNSGFEYGQQISEHSLKKLNDLLAYCMKNDIYVIGFLPPFAKEVWQEIKNNGKNYQYMFEIKNKSSSIFKKYGFEFYDYTDLNSVNASNCEIINGNHGSEKAYLRILIDMGENSKNLKSYVDIDYLKNKLKQSQGCFLTIEKLSREENKLK